MSVLLFSVDSKTNYNLLSYNPRLDGLRAIAVLMVVFHHYRIPGFNGGMYGVDIFFVLSGFLITQILIKGQQQKQSLFLFYWRRFLRLMPALAFLCFGFLIFSFVSGGLIPPRYAITDIFASLFYMSNWTRAFTIGVPAILGNTWSLAIEEQFYLIWPLLFLFLTSKNKSKNVLLITFFIFLISATWGIYADYIGIVTERVYNGFDTHCSGLILGCCLALLNQFTLGEKIFKSIAKFWLLATISLICLVIFIQSGIGTALPSLAASLIAAILIITACYNPTSLLGKILEKKSMVSVGKISYSLYLWHYPIWLILYSYAWSWNAITWIGIPLSFLMATISYHLIEKNMLRYRDSTTLPLKRLGTITVSFSILGMLISGIYFLHEPIVNALFPSPINIVDYSPHRLGIGETANVQADGNSYLMIVASQILPKGTKLRLDGQEYNPFLSKKIIAIPIPSNLQLQIGKKEIILVSAVGASLAPPIYLDIFGK